MVMQLARPAAAVAAGSSHSCVVTENGEVYVWGSNQNGQLGLPTAEELRPTLLKLQENAIGIACGYYHTLILTESGRVLSFGESDNGKLGLADEYLGLHHHPQYITLKEKVVQVAAGSSHSVLLTEGGAIYTCGLGSSGQLGQGTSQLECQIPHLISINSHLSFVAISAGHSHCAALTDKGKVVTWGCGRHGKLCHGEENFSSQFVPVVVKRLRHLCAALIACGGCHTMVLGFRRNEVEGEADVNNSNPTSLSSLARARKRVNDGTLPPLKSSGLPPLKPSVVPTVPDTEDNTHENLTDSQQIDQDQSVSVEWCNSDSNFTDNTEEQQDIDNDFTSNNNDKKATKFTSLFTWWKNRKSQATSHVAEMSEDEQNQDLEITGTNEESKTEDDDTVSDQTLMVDDSQSTIESQEPPTKSTTLGSHKSSKACAIL